MTDRAPVVLGVDLGRSTPRADCPVTALGNPTDSDRDTSGWDDSSSIVGMA